MYQVILVNLTADARAVAPRSRVPLPGVSDAQLRELLLNFTAIDPIENANADTELRVVVRHDNFLLRSLPGGLVLYDMRHRDLPGQAMPLEKILAELDGRAGLARQNVLRQARGIPALGSRQVKPAVPRREADPRKTAILGIAALGLLLANYQFWPQSVARYPANFTKPNAAEITALGRNLAGVYLTGNGAGQHGMVATGPNELKLFELAAIEAPRVVYATFVPGWSGARFMLVTDQPGGIIDVKSDGTLVYCGEIYRHIP